MEKEYLQVKVSQLKGNNLLMAPPLGLLKDVPRSYPTMALFWEKRGTYGSESTKYTLKDYEHNGYPSLYKLYLDLEDTTEWEFANAYLDGYEHWLRLCACDWFKPYVARWRKELELKLKARQLRTIAQIANADDQGTNKYNAAKYLLDKGYVIEPVAKTKRGRPSNQEVSEEATRLAEEDIRIKEDFKRMNEDDSR